MSFSQASSTGNNAPLLSVPETFVELKKVDNSYMSFSFNCRISLTNQLKDPRDYEKVVIYVFKDEDSAITAAGSSSSTSTVVNSVTKMTSNIKIENVFTVNANKVHPLYKQSILQKIIDGKKMIQLLQKKEDYLAEPQELSISSYRLNSIMSNNMSVVEMVAIDNKENEEYPQVTSNIDTSSLIFNINRNIQDITSPTDETSINSKSNLYGNISELISKNNRLYIDMIRYYLVDVKKSNFEASSQVYEKRRTSKRLPYFDLSTGKDVLVSSLHKNSIIKVRFDLYKKGGVVPDETVTKTFNAADHVSAYYALKYPPVVSFKNKPGPGNFIDISIHDQEKNGNISGYNIYLKSIDRLGNASDYKLHGKIDNLSTNIYSIPLESDLSIVRVVPFETSGKESNLFTNVVIGPGYNEMGNLTIAPHYSNDSKKVVIEVFNLPKTASTATLYKRDCTSESQVPFLPVTTARLGNETNNLLFTDSLQPGRIFEYYVCILSNSYYDKKEFDKKYVSNFAFLKHPNMQEGSPPAIKVDINNFVSQIDGEGILSNAFNIDVSVSNYENAIITEAFKKQLGDLYDRFLNPANNSNSPIGNENYTDLIMHEVIRTNLNTSERESFNLVSKGKFVDNKDTQSISGVKPLSAQNSYIYQIFSYRRDPTTLIKDYIAGDDKKGYYLPYKWKNPAVITTGKLYADDTSGIPVIDLYDSLTSQSYGLTASYSTQLSTQIAQLKNISASRLDINTVRINWFYTLSSEYSRESLYDSFIVMKSVNGTRSFVGRTRKNFIYHEIKEEDLGAVYYIVVPIMKNFSIDEPGYSNEIFINSEEFIPPVPIPVFSLAIQNSGFEKID